MFEFWAKPLRSEEGLEFPEHANAQKQNIKTLYKMPNVNGLLPCSKVATSGDPPSVLYAKRVAPVVVDPLTIVSQDGESSAILGVNNNGNFIMYPTNPAGATYFGGGQGIYVQSADSTNETGVYTANDGTTLITGSDSMRLVLTETGGGNSFTVQKGPGVGAIGEIYDTVYNPPVVITDLLTYSGAAEPLEYNQPLTLAEGTYRIEMFAETVVPQIGTRLRMYLSGPNPASTVVNYANNSMATDTAIAEFSMSTGTFSVEAGTFTLRVTSSGANWTATQWGIQLLKLA